MKWFRPGSGDWLCRHWGKPSEFCILPSFHIKESTPACYEQRSWGLMRRRRSVSYLRLPCHRSLYHKSADKVQVNSFLSQLICWCHQSRTCVTGTCLLLESFWILITWPCHISFVKHWLLGHVDIGTSLDYNEYQSSHVQTGFLRILYHCAFAVGWRLSH